MLIIAWGIEIFAVFLGLLLAVYAGIEGSTSGLMGMLIAMLPFVALSLTELTKIPLVALAFGVRSIFWKLIATLALGVVTFATFENFIFSFERGFTERLAMVSEAEMQAEQAVNRKQAAEQRLPGLIARQTDLVSQLSGLREEIDAARNQALQEIRNARDENAASEFRSEREHLDREIGQLDARRAAEVDRERRRCAQQPDTRCNVSAIEANYRRQREDIQRRIQDLLGRQNSIRDRAEEVAAAARQRRDAELEAKERERFSTQTQLEAARREIASAQEDVYRGTSDAQRLARARDEMVQKSQMHRLASVLFGNDDKASIDATKKIFVVSLAAIVALIGSLLAALHYAALYSSVPRKRPIANAIRGYFARKRRSTPITASALRRPGLFGKLTVSLRAYLVHRRRNRVEIREVEKPVERLKLIYIPLDVEDDQIAKIRRENGMHTSSVNPAVHNSMRVKAAADA